MFPAQLSIPVNTSLPTGTEPGWAHQPVTSTSPHAVVIHVLRAVGDPAWAPGPAAELLLEQVDDALVLRRARALLRIVTQHRIDVTHARAFATITLALNRLSDREGHHASPSTPVSVEAGRP